MVSVILMYLFCSLRCILDEQMVDSINLETNHQLDLKQSQEQLLGHLVEKQYQYA